MKKLVWAVFFLVAVLCGQAQPKIELVEKKAESRIDVLVGGELFTSYLYSKNIKKPVLWPVIAPAGQEITRQYPLKIKAGERADHPHHIGMWFNYGNVNGLDFWNNSNAVSSDKADKYGSVHHESVKKMESGRGEAFLTTSAAWKNSSGKTLLHEMSEYTFSAGRNVRIIDRKILLKAADGKVEMDDNKEGMFAMRVTRELELPSSGNIKVVDSEGNVIETDASGTDIANGNYLSSEGTEGSKVWGTRAKWMKLHGKVNDEAVAVVIFDHPGNPGYPTYWHARGYGLFAANPLGQEVFSGGEKKMNFEIEKDKSVIFRYRVAVFSGNPGNEEIETLAKEFKNKI